MPYNRKNNLAFFCFAGLCLNGLAPGGSRVARAASAGDVAPEPVIHTASVVRADARTGRLVRKMVVQGAAAETAGATKATPAGSPVKPESAAGTATPVPVEPLAAAQDRVLRAMVDREVEHAASKYGVDPKLVHAVIRVESNYNPVAISPKGAQGLMQLIPATARRMGVDNSFNVRENIEGGVRYLRYLLDRFGDHRLALAAYNAGEGAVDRYGTVPPYLETQQYVRRAGKLFNDAQRDSAPLAAAPEAAPAKPAEPLTRPIEIYLDSEGRICIRTR
jgi:soluble lytic murein transglycosylase-like protein